MTSDWLAGVRCADKGRPDPGGGHEAEFLGPRRSRGQAGDGARPRRGRQASQAA